MKRVLTVIRWIIGNLDWLLAIILSVVTFVLGLLQQVSIGTVATVTLLVLGMLSFSALRDRDTTEDLKKVVGSLEEKSSAVLKGEDLLADKALTGITRVLPNAVEYPWLPLIQRARNITLARIRLEFSDNPRYFDAFTRVLDEGGSVTLIISDPRCPEMWLRYHEEPNPLNSPTAWSSGLENIANNLISLHTWRQSLLATGHDVSRLSIKAFPHYPSQAFYRFDNSIYVYHYSYLERGFHAPMFLFTNPATSVYRYLMECLNSVVEASIPVQDVIEDVRQQLAAGHLSDRVARSARFVTVTQGGEE